MLESYSQELKPIETTISQYQAIKDLTIHNAAEERICGETIAILKMTLKGVEEKRVLYTAPLNQSLKRINADFKAFSTPIQNEINRFSEAFTAYRESEARKEAEAYRAQIQEEARKAAQAGNIEALKDLSQANTELEKEAPKVVRTQDGSVSTRRVWTYEIEDVTRIPTEFWAVDEAKISAAVKSGIRTINGVRIFEKTIVATRSV